MSRTFIPLSTHPGSESPCDPLLTTPKIAHGARSKGRTPVSQQGGRHLHLLAVAERLFLDKGYHHVSLALVASSAGVATRTIYSSFGNKRALLELILERRRDASADALAALAAERLL